MAALQIQLSFLDLGHSFVGENNDSRPTISRNQWTSCSRLDDRASIETKLARIEQFQAAPAAQLVVVLLADWP